MWQTHTKLALSVVLVCGTPVISHVWMSKKRGRGHGPSASLWTYRKDCGAHETLDSHIPDLWPMNSLQRFYKNWEVKGEFQDVRRARLTACVDILDQTGLLLRDAPTLLSASAVSGASRCVFYLWRLAFMSHDNLNIQRRDASETGKVELVHFPFGWTGGRSSGHSFAV